MSFITRSILSFLLIIILFLIRLLLLPNQSDESVAAVGVVAFGRKAGFASICCRTGGASGRVCGSAREWQPGAVLYCAGRCVSRAAGRSADASARASVDADGPSTRPVAVLACRGSTAGHARIEQLFVACNKQPSACSGRLVCRTSILCSGGTAARSPARTDGDSGAIKLTLDRRSVTFTFTIIFFLSDSLSAWQTESSRFSLPPLPLPPSLSLSLVDAAGGSYASAHDIYRRPRASGSCLFLFFCRICLFFLVLFLLRFCICPRLVFLLLLFFLSFESAGAAGWIGGGVATSVCTWSTRAAAVVGDDGRQRTGTQDCSEKE